MTDVDMVQSLAGCTLEQAQSSLNEYGSVEAAVDALLARPTVSGQKYIPQIVKRSHQDSEQEERCANGRALMDKLTVVASAAHSKIRSGQALAAHAVQQVDSVPDETKSVVTVPEVQQDDLAETLPSS
jgi:hypothetical protein